MTMHERNSNKRLIISLAVSVLIHACVILLVYFLSQKFNSTEPKLTKIDPSNLLVLKRGHSQDVDKNNPGALPQSTAANPAPLNSQSFPMQEKFVYQNQDNRENKKDFDNKQAQQKKQIDSQDKALNQYDKSPIDPRNLSFLSPQQALAYQSSLGSAYQGLASIEANNGTDQQTRQEIDELYGEEFGDLGNAEKDFITNNLRDIGRITQKYLERLGYPRTAAYLGQDGQNAAEFYLHPNGDISDLKVLTKSGSVILDRNTIKTIEIAYKDYPRPSVRTLIRIRVKYFMY